MPEFGSFSELYNFCSLKGMEKNIRKACNWVKYRFKDENDKKDKYKRVVCELVNRNPFVIAVLPLDFASVLYKYVGLDEARYEERKRVGKLARQCYCKVNGIQYSDKKIEQKKDYSNDVGIVLSSMADFVTKEYMEEYQLVIQATINSVGEEAIIIQDRYISNVEEYVGDFLVNKTVSVLAKVQTEEIVEVLKSINKNPDKDLISALYSSCQNPVSIITGAAGTGKTVCVEALCSLCREKNVNYKVVSFTGKAIANLCGRLSDTSDGGNFSTIHSLWGKYRAREKEAQDLYPCGNGLLIIEEASMVATPLIYKLFKCIEKAGHDLQIVMVGDNDQLPPIGWGRFFYNCIESKKFPVNTLVTNYRINGGSIVIQNAAYFKQEAVKNKFNWSVEQCEAMFSKELDILLEIFRDTKNYSKVMVISPWKKRKDAINMYCQKHLRNGQHCIKFNFREFYIDDKIIITRNSNKDGVYNGSDGMIISINESMIIDLVKNDDKKYWYIPAGSYTCKTIIPVAFKDKQINCRAMVIEMLKDGKQITIPFYCLDSLQTEDEDDEDKELRLLNSRVQISDIDLAYCITTHKAQGSEAELVFYDFMYGYNPSDYLPGGRSNVYTALTRTRQKFIYNGAKQHIHQLFKRHTVTHDRLSFILSCI